MYKFDELKKGETILLRKDADDSVIDELEVLFYSNNKKAIKFCRRGRYGSDRPNDVTVWKEVVDLKQNYSIVDFT